jgi:hypothetical protein
MAAARSLLPRFSHRCTNGHNIVPVLRHRILEVEVLNNGWILVPYLDSDPCYASFNLIRRTGKELFKHVFLKFFYLFLVPFWSALFEKKSFWYSRYPVPYLLGEL